MEKIDSVLIIDEDKLDSLFVEKLIKELNVATKISIAHNRKEALAFLEEGCLIEKKNCPEFIFLNIGKQSIYTPDFFDTLSNINNAIQSKIQVVFLLDQDNKSETGKIKSLGIDYVFKPITKEKIDHIFQRYFFLKSVTL